MSEPTVVWRSGERWRQLAADLAEAGLVTVISENGTARFLDLEVGQHTRLPLRGGHLMPLDARWRPLEAGGGLAGWALDLTPCGLTLNGRYEQAAGTPLWAVLEGFWSTNAAIGGAADWTTTSLGQVILDEISRGNRPNTSRAHPVEPCGALYCPGSRLFWG